MFWWAVFAWVLIHECANLRHEMADQSCVTGNQAFSRFWRTSIETTGSPSSGNLFPIGWNWDEAHALKFIAGTHTWGIRLLQVVHFVVAPWKLRYFGEIWRKTCQFDEASGAPELGNEPKQTNCVYWACLCALYKPATCGLVHWLGVPDAFGCYSLNVVTCYNRNDHFVAVGYPMYRYLR